jgi:hypothetical protein
MIQFLIKLVILIAVVYCVRLLFPLLGLPEPFATVGLVILALIGLLYLIGYIGDGSGNTFKLP